VACPRTATCPCPLPAPSRAAVAVPLLAWLAVCAPVGGQGAGGPLEAAQRLAAAYEYEQATEALAELPRGGLAPQELGAVDLALGRYLWAQNRLEEAQVALRRAADLPEGDPQTHADGCAALMEVLLASGASGEAVAMARRLPWEDLPLESVLGALRCLVAARDAGSPASLRSAARPTRARSTDIRTTCS